MPLPTCLGKGQMRSDRGLKVLRYAALCSALSQLPLPCARSSCLPFFCNPFYPAHSLVPYFTALNQLYFGSTLLQYCRFLPSRPS